MKPKDKANELVQRFSKLDKGLNEKEWIDREVSFEEIHKQSALICVDEIIDTLNQSTLEFEYWQEVKQEINKI